MAVYDILPDTNLKGVDVRDTLNANGGSVGDNFTSFFTSGANLDMWSRFKPIVLNLPFINLWDKRTTTDYYYQGSDGKCGLTIPVYYQVSTFKTALTNGLNKTAWSYTPPTGGENAPMRVGDFRRYNPKAINPMSSIPANLIATRSGTSDSVQIDIEVNVPTGTDYNLGISDFAVDGIKFANMYPGVYLVKKGATSGRFRTSTSKLGTNGQFSVKFPLDYDEGGEYTAYTFLSSKVQGDDEQGDCTLVSIGGTSMTGSAQAVKIQPAGTLFVIGASAYAEANTKNYYYEVYIKNNDSAARTFTNVRMQVQHDFGNGYENEGYSVRLADTVSVPAGGTKMFTNIDGSPKQHSVVFDMNGLQTGKFAIIAYSETPEVSCESQPFEQAEVMALKL